MLSHWDRIFPKILQDSMRFHEILLAGSTHFHQVPSVSMKFQQFHLYELPSIQVPLCLHRDAFSNYGHSKSAQCELVVSRLKQPAKNEFWIGVERLCIHLKRQWYVRVHGEDAEVVGEHTDQRCSMIEKSVKFVEYAPARTHSSTQSSLYIWHFSWSLQSTPLPSLPLSAWFRSEPFNVFEDPNILQILIRGRRARSSDWEV